MIPADPTSSGPGPMLQHVTTLQNDFRKFDTAKQNKDSDADNIVSRDDFKAVVADKSGRFSQADVEAAQFFLDHPDAFARLDTAAASDNSPGVNEEPDGRIGQLDVQAGVRDASDFDGAATFTTQQPALPTDHANQAQQDADLLLHLQTAEDQNDPGLEPHEAEQTFTQLLQQHHGDVGYLHDLFGALGARAGGRALYQALGTEGQSRTEARDAIDTLRNNGLLTDKELAAAQFKTAPDASAGFSLKTLLGADQVQRQVDANRARLGQAGYNPLNTTAYDAYDAVLTVQSPDNKAFIEQTAAKYGIDPALLGGTVASEMDFDLSPAAKSVDSLWRNTPLHFGQGPGVASVHHDSLVWAAKYLKDHGDPSAAAAQQFIDSDPHNDHAADFKNSTEAAAVMLKALTLARKEGGAGNTTATDMAVTWGAYRSGVKGLTPDGKGFEMGDFLANHVDADAAAKLASATGDPDAAGGANAYQSEPYFQYLQQNYG